MPTIPNFMTSEWPAGTFYDSIDVQPIPNAPAGIDPMSQIEPIPLSPAGQDPYSLIQLLSSSGASPSQQSPDSFIPQSYLNMLAGLPSMQFDSMGRMGITDDQRRAAQNQGMGDMLMGVAQGFLNVDPMAPMKGGAIAGQNMQSMLDNYSKQNLANTNAILDNKIKQLTAFGLMSNLEQGQVALDSAKLKLDQDKKANSALQDVAQHYAPLVDFAGDLAAANMPDEESKKNVRDSINAASSVMFAELKRGNIDKAMNVFNTQIGQWLDLDPNLTKAKIAQLTNQGLAQVEVTSNMIPALQKQAEALGAKLEIGPDGKPTFIHPYAQQLRELEVKKAEAAIRVADANVAESRARESYYQSGGGNAESRQLGVAVERTYKDFNDAVSVISQFNGKKAFGDDKKKLESAQKILRQFGVADNAQFIELWNKSSEQQRAEWIASQLKHLRGTVAP